MMASVCTLASAALAQTPNASEAPKPAVGPVTEEQKTFYALGLSMGRSLGLFKLTPEELEMVRLGLYAQVKGEKPAVDISEYGPKIQTLAMNRQSASASDEKAKGQAFLEKAAKEKGAVKAPAGFVYQELKKGKGASPSGTDIVKVHYRGTLIDGTEFDSSYKREEPATFPLQDVIRCWTEGVQRMKQGGKARLVCPSDLAYGDRGSPPQIPGGATLIFEVELLEVTKGTLKEE